MRWNILAALFNYFTAPAGSPSAKAHTGRLFVLAGFVSIVLAVTPVIHFVATGRAWSKELLDFVAEVVFWLPATFAGLYAVRQGMNTVVQLKNGGSSGGQAQPAQDANRVVG